MQYADYRLQTNPAHNVCITINGNGQKGMVQIDAPPVENFWLRHWCPRWHYDSIKNSISQCYGNLTSYVVHYFVRCSTYHCTFLLD